MRLPCEFPPGRRPAKAARLRPGGICRPTARAIRPARAVGWWVLPVWQPGPEGRQMVAVVGVAVRPGGPTDGSRGREPPERGR
ncbi:hypothetical protein LCGC14_2245370 [marine sediment metagenome]|uniref:Uncharacterized protein n=1 Tax=marine sediment metagenome TaxID=412755 RepID=A0A0F9FZ91_9ZZZZ